MNNPFPGRSGFRQVRALAALFLVGAAVCLAKFSVAPPQLAGREHARGDLDRRERYMPVPGGERGETNQLNRMEEEWNNRITYPTGVFDPAWVRAAARVDSLIASAVPSGVPLKNLNLSGSPLVLSPNGFTSLGPSPLQMTGCTGCYDYTKTEGRVNSIAVDPTTTTNGSIVAYSGAVGGGVWKTTNCCSASTTRTVVTDDPLISTTAIDTVTIDPNNHNTIYAGTGDL